MPGLRAMYREHLEALADEYGADLNLFDPAPGMEYRARLLLSTLQRPLVLAPVPVNRSRYISGLHEFGHLDTRVTADLKEWGTTAGKTPAGEGLYGELLASLWAFGHAKVAPTARDAADVLGDLHWEANRTAAGNRPLSDPYAAELVPSGYRATYRAGLDRLHALCGRA